AGARDPRSHSGFLAGGEGGRETLVVDAREGRSAGAPSSACDLAPGGTCLGGCPTVTLLIPDRSVREAGGVFLPVRFCGRLFSKQELELIREIARDYAGLDRKSTRLNSSHDQISYAVFCLKKKKKRK